MHDRLFKPIFYHAAQYLEKRRICRRIKPQTLFLIKKHTMRTYILIALLLTAAAAKAQEISQTNLQKHVTFLASDKLQGRGTGTKAELKAAQYLAKTFKKYGLEPKGDKGYFHEFTFKRSADPHSAPKPNAPEERSRNVVAYLNNNAAHTIVIGAHYDHLGLGTDHNSLDANPQGKIHNGADDNASGTAGVLELARYYAQNSVQENYNFLFICFSGEELGLLGSKRYTENPTIDLSTVNFMINMDMIGRLNEEKRLVVGGVGTAPNFVPLLILKIYRCCSSSPASTVITTAPATTWKKSISPDKKPFWNWPSKSSARSTKNLNWFSRKQNPNRKTRPASR
jgi:hypothetical protein